MRELKLGSLMAQPCPDYVIAGIAEILKDTEGKPNVETGR